MCDGLRKSADNDDQNSLNSAFSNMAQCYKYTGIMVISIIVLYFLVLIGILFMFNANSPFSKDIDAEITTEYETSIDSTDEYVVIDTATSAQ